MQRQNPLLVHALTELRLQSLGDPSLMATLMNLTHDQRIAPGREDRLVDRLAFEADGNPIDATVFGRACKAHFDLHIRWNRHQPDIPEIYTPANANAALLADPPSWRELVRVFRLNAALAAMGANSAADLRSRAGELRQAARVVREGMPQGGMDVGQASGLLRNLLVQVNRFDTPPPSFCGRLEDVRTEADRTDWAERLRERFGLGHLDASPDNPMVVLQLRYTAETVWTRERPAAIADLDVFRVPSTMDANFYDYFFPAPSGQQFGRTVDLRGGEQRLTSEMIHFPVDIGIEDIHDVAVIDTPIPGVALADARNDHLAILRREFDLPDYAEMM